MMLEVEPDKVLTVKPDKQGRVTVGAEYAEEEVQVVVVADD